MPEENEAIQGGFYIFLCIYSFVYLFKIFIVPFISDTNLDEQEANKIITVPIIVEFIGSWGRSL